MSSKKSFVLRQSSYNSLYVNPLVVNNNNYHNNNNDLKHTRNCSDGDLIRRKTLGHQLFGDTNFVSSDNNNKENLIPPPPLLNSKESVVVSSKNKINVVPLGERNLSVEEELLHKNLPPSPLVAKSKLLKSSSLQLCMHLNEPDSTFGLKVWDHFESDHSSGANVWDHSDSEAAPASSWSTLPNRYLLCRPLPLDIGRCTCVIVKEALLEGQEGGCLYSLYTNEGQGRQDRKLALAHQRRRNGRSKFTVAQNAKGLLCSSDEGILGTITANFMGSKYNIWDQRSTLDPVKKQSNLLLAVVGFVPTITTCTGSYRSLRAWIPKHQSMQLKNTAKIQHINGLPKDWEVTKNKTQQLFSRVPHFNNISRQYELDFRERGRAGLRIQSSVKNFQLTLEVNRLVIYSTCL
ncbi:hypothetical protein AQUCO_03100091v1 [Aquilegia coerulea]|uniref:Tubby C-terminal domain-containing protein n=1 Tax=Aquilegia coerulea TaxID=218851 RepID=A0A2G5D0R1_AQUCA|nr:hypothetical protein AQUCO_03100091v1 [Aquilegia coerulea]